MEHLTNEEIAKLPKWAQQKVRTLQMRLNEATEEIKRINTNEPSNTVVGFEHTHKDMDKPTYLKDGQLITFKLEKGKYITARIKENFLDINGNNGLLIVPRASNAFEIIMKS